MSIVTGMVSVPFSLTLANALSPMRFKLACKKVADMVVSENAVRESNAYALISTILYAFAEFPLPL